MANEAIKRYDESSGHGGVIQDYTCADGTGIEKGTVLKLTDPRTVAAADADDCMIAGIAAREKVANDGRTQIAVYKKGYFDMVCSGAVAIGNPVSSYAGTGANANVIHVADSAVSGAAIIGYAEETAAANERVIVRVDL